MQIEKYNNMIKTETEKYNIKLESKIAFDEVQFWQVNGFYFGKGKQKINYTDNEHFSWEFWQDFDKSCVIILDKEEYTNKTIRIMDFRQAKIWVWYMNVKLHADKYMEVF